MSCSTLFLHNTIRRENISVAVADALSGRRGVLHVSLRTCTDAEEVRRKIAGALGFHDRLSSMCFYNYHLNTNAYY
jgi:hypothetical protein